MCFHPVARQLISIALFAIVCIFIYSVVSFALFRDFFEPESALFCETLWQCFLTVLRVGLLSSFHDVSNI